MAELPRYLPMNGNPRRDRPVMMIDALASFEDIHDCAGRRLSAAKAMLFTMATIGATDASAADGRDISNIADAAYLLLEDADDLLLAAQRAHTREVRHGRA